MRNANGTGCIRKLSGKRRKPYQVIVTVGWEMVDGNAKQIQKSLGTFETRKEAEIARGKYNCDPSSFDATGMTFADLFHEYSKVIIARADNTKDQKRSFFNQSKNLHDMKIADITSEDLQMIVSSKKSRNTQGMYISFYRDMWKYGMSEGFVRKNPAEYLLKDGEYKEEEINPFTYAEYLKMPREYDLFFYTGLRADEMLSLKKENIRLEDNIIVVPGTKTGNALRYVPISPKIAPIIEEKTDRIWTLHKSYVNLLREVKRLTGGVHATHDMRKSFATALAKQKVDAITIKRLLGHSVNDVTENHYIKRDFSELRKAVNNLDLTELA